MKQRAGIRYIFLILVGILILLYPYISSSWNR
ncbi:class C sortase, partial [Streptococcus suis]|nr:class C sortase [Streptococcus suis]